MGEAPARYRSRLCMPWSSVDFRALGCGTGAWRTVPFECTSRDRLRTRRKGRISRLQFMEAVAGLAQGFAAGTTLLTHCWPRLAHEDLCSALS